MTTAEAKQKNCDVIINLTIQTLGRIYARVF
jgi:hypothetical protein